MKRIALAVVLLVAAPLIALPALAVAFAQSLDAASCSSDPGPLTAARAARAAGFTGEDLVVAVAIAGAESSYQPTARNSIGASGLWQILESAHPDLFRRYDWHDPTQNAAMAFIVWTAARQTWNPWTTYTTGAYLARLAEARAAVQQLALPSDVACGDAGNLPGAEAFGGGSDGCTVADPSGTGGCVTPATAWVLQQVDKRFGHLPVACWSARAGDPYSDHPKGKACDYTVGRIGTYPGPDDTRRGWTLANWLRANAVPLHVNYVIWQGRIWSRAHDAEG